MLLFTRISIAANPVTHLARPAPRSPWWLCVAGGIVAASVAFVAAIGWTTYLADTPSDHVATDRIVSSRSGAKASGTIQVDALPPPR